MGTFSKILDNGHNRKHCKIFKPCLYAALSLDGAPRTTARVGKDDAYRYKQGINIYQYEMIMIPILIDKQWSSIAIDTVKIQIRYLNKIYKRGSEILIRIKLWFRSNGRDFKQNLLRNGRRCHPHTG